MVRAILNACQEIVAKNPGNYDIAYIPDFNLRPLTNELGGRLDYGQPWCCFQPDMGHGLGEGLRFVLPCAAMVTLLHGHAPTSLCLYIPLLRKRGRCGSLSLSLLLLRDSLLSGNGNLRCYRIRCGKTHGSVDSLLDTILPF